MKLTKRRLAAEICKREGGKSQAKIGDVMQIIGHLFDVLEEMDQSCSLINELQTKASEKWHKRDRKQFLKSIKKAYGKKVKMI